MRDQFSERGVVLENALAYWIHRVYQASRNEMYRSFREVSGEEITPEQWIVLVRLSATEGSTQGELAEATYRDRPTMSRLLAGMERRGLVRRVPDERDERVWRVHLGPRAAKLRDKLLPEARAMVKRLEAGISERDLEITRATLRRMFENVEG